jgi:hypothetical protein
VTTTDPQRDICYNAQINETRSAKPKPIAVIIIRLLLEIYLPIQGKPESGEPTSTLDAVMDNKLVKNYTMIQDVQTAKSELIADRN